MLVPKSYPQTKTVAIVGFIELKDRIDYMEKGAAATDSSDLSLNEAQLAAMLENAKNSTWQENLHNARDAQDRFMLAQNEDGGNGTPEYVKIIHDRRQEMLRDEGRRREQAKDSSSTRFWK